jgi:hypothetical protein
LHKALEDTGIKLDCVASDILGRSGRAMLGALVTGTTDPIVLADLAKGKLRAKIPALREALEGRFEPHHALIIGAILAHIDFLNEHIDELSEAIEVQLGPTGLVGVQLASTIPGVAARTAEVMVAEIGIDTYLAAQYQRLKPRIGHGRALGAVKHSIVIAYWHMFTTGELYNDLGGDYFQRRDPAKATKRLVDKLEALGHRVTLEPVAT